MGTINAETLSGSVREDYMTPNLSGRNHTYGCLADPEFSRYERYAISGISKIPNLDCFFLSEFMPSMRRTNVSVMARVKGIVADVLALRHVFKIPQAGIGLFKILVVDLHTCWRWANKCSHDETMDKKFLSPPIAGEKNSPVSPGRKKPTQQPITVSSWDNASHAAQIAHFIQGFITNYWSPAFHFYLLILIIAQTRRGS